jgi:hypothetical protein
MSHFTVTCVLPQEPKSAEHVQEMIAEMIAPYDENERVEPYKSYITPLPEGHATMDRRELPWPWGYLRDEASDLDLTDSAAVVAWINSKWADEQHGLDETGIYTMSTYNPQSKWDWWSVGGRWTGFYKLREGATGMMGVSGAFGNAPEPGHVDVAQKGSIDDSDKRVQTYAVLAEGVWRSPGKMGWFGMSSETNDEQQDFDAWFQTFWTTMPDEAWLAVIDCHI